MKRPASYTITMAVIAAAFLLLTVMGEAYGGSASGNLQVEATVGFTLEYTIVCNGTVCPAPGISTTWDISQGDLDTGYRDVTPGSIVSVTTNDTNGYLLRVCSAPDPSEEGTYIIRYIEITMPATGIGLLKLPHPGCKDIPIPYQGDDPVESQLNYRFYLRQSADPGTYLWPMDVTVIPF